MTTKTATKGTKSTQAKTVEPGLKDRFSAGDKVQSTVNKKIGTISNVATREVKILWEGETQPKSYNSADLDLFMIDKIGKHKDWPSPNWANDSPSFAVPGYTNKLWAQWILTSAESGSLAFYDDSEAKPENCIKSVEISLQDSHKYQAIATAATELAKTLSTNAKQSSVSNKKSWPDPSWEENSKPFALPEVDNVWCAWHTADLISGKLLYHSDAKMLPGSFIKAIRINQKDCAYETIEQAAIAEYAASDCQDIPSETLLIKANLPGDSRDRKTLKVAAQSSIYYACKEYENGDLIYPDGYNLYVKKDSSEIVNNAAKEKDSDCWYTPKEIIDLVLAVLEKIDLDPCADEGKHVPASAHFTAAEDGLRQDWTGKIFMNPPYSCPGKWIAKLQAEFEAENVTEAIALVPASTDTNWLHPLLATQPVAFWKGRIKFLDVNYQPKLAARQSHCLVYWGANAAKFKEVFEPHGTVQIPGKSSSENNQNQSGEKPMLDPKESPAQPADSPAYDYKQFTTESAQQAQQVAIFEREIIKQDFQNRLKHGEMLTKIAATLEGEKGATKGKKTYTDWLKSPVVGKYGKVEAMRNRALYEWFNERSEKVQELLLEKVWQIGIDGMLALAKLPEHLQSLLGYLLQLKEITKSEIKKAATAFAIGGKVKIVSGAYAGQIGTVQTVPEGKHGGFNLLLENGEIARAIVEECYPFEAAPKPEKVRANKEESEAVQAMQLELEVSRERISQLEKEVEQNRVDKAQLAEQAQVTNKVVSVLGMLAKQLGWQTNGTGDLLAELEAFASGLGQVKTPQPAPELLAA